MYGLNCAGNQPGNGKHFNLGFILGGFAERDGIGDYHLLDV
jgi:hypothetical protein